VLAAALLVSLVAGCGDPGGPYAAVSGRVTANGDPLSGAVVTFEPIEGTGGPKASAPVFDGQYRVEPSAKLRDGQYRVRISMIPESMLKKMRGQNMEGLPPPGSAIRPQFDTETTLRRELSADQPNELSFDVELLP
jgi:hypothetical protein